MVLQHAYYEVSGGLWTSTYETGSVRGFKLGRTETIRTCSIESVNFVKICSNTSIPSNVKFTALKNACLAHTQYTKLAMKGHGTDRLLFGLKRMLKPDEPCILLI